VPPRDLAAQGIPTAESLQGLAYAVDSPVGVEAEHTMLNIHPSRPPVKQEAPEQPPESTWWTFPTQSTRCPNWSQYHSADT
jgi:hypothetical protein